MQNEDADRDNFSKNWYFPFHCPRAVSDRSWLGPGASCHEILVDLKRMVNFIPKQSLRFVLGLISFRRGAEEMVGVTGGRWGAECLGCH